MNGLPPSIAPLCKRHASRPHFANRAERAGDASASDIGTVFAALARELGPVVPLPGHGHTLQRWRLLAAVAANDLSLVKLFEAHADALAILHEAGLAERFNGKPDARWAVWCSEHPADPLIARAAAGRDAGEPGAGKLTLHGRKHWCSGAAFVSDALVSCVDEQGNRLLAAVDLRQPGVSWSAASWQALGMADTATATVSFDRATGWKTGAAGFYLDRPGFWHGGAGIAACWFGAATALADYARETLAEARAKGAPIHASTLSHLGKLEASLGAAAAYLRELAAFIDAEPRADCARRAIEARILVESVVEETLMRVGHALGPRIYCQDAWSARLLADLPVFIRQSYAERDWGEAGKACLDAHTEQSAQSALWAL